MTSKTAEWIMPGIRRVQALNPSPMTGQGTNSYLIGSGAGLLLIDPGPDDPDHLLSLMSALDPGEFIQAIVVTHAHLDHSGLVAKAKARTSAPVYAFGAATDGRSPQMTALAQAGLTGGGEGVDALFQPDIRLGDQDRLTGDFGELRVWHTPGHMGCHICLQWDDVLFSGDHVMGWSTSLVSPPDGDMAAYVQSLEKLHQRTWALMLPGHGPAIRHTAQRLEELIAHRKMREAQVLESVSNAPGRPSDIAARIYQDTPPALLPAAARNVLAHLIDLQSKSLVATERQLGEDSIFYPVK